MAPSSVKRAEIEWEKGCEWRRKGHLEQAAVHLQTAARLAPKNSQYRVVLAHVHAKIGNRDEALIQARVAFDLDRTSMLACRVLAEMLLKASRSKEALQVLDSLHEDTPRSAEWHLARTEALMSLAHFSDAVREGSAALALAGNDESNRCLALVRMGSSFQNLRAYAEAALCYRMLLDSHPESLLAAVHAVHASSCACDWPSLMDDVARMNRCVSLLQQRTGPIRQEVNPFGLITVTDDPEFQRWVAEVSFSYKSHGIRPDVLKTSAPGASLRASDGKVRIGFLGSDFHQHATMILIVEMMEFLSKERLDIFIYSGGPEDASGLRARAKAAATQWCEIGQMSSEEIAIRIRDDGVAVLLEMKGYTLMNRLDVVAYRAAPLQVSWLGYPGTTGAQCMDYVIGDPWVTPLDAQAGYTECIAQMPHCYQPNDSGRSVPALPGRAACGLPEEAFVFASFNMPYKIVPEMFEAWCRILLATPGSVLWLLVRETETRERLACAAAAHGVDRDRLIFAPMLAPEVHRARLGHADLMLDCFPCSGHTTASDALWAGVPVLTLYGRSFASRVAASLLSTLELPELVCAEIDTYMQRAVQLAQDKVALDALRQRLAKARVESPLFDGRRYARDFERLLLRMIERHEAGLPPAPLAAELS
ncbi:MAG: hypothetical protein L6Q74_14760 [Sphaerotilus natans subsp. sulfidivorans]|uniref:O-linked N-acetylglucosamine transferase, SPINDLY family protein n=1 Tax=Sphaerotilus sulfidivorans TaxID=639200 RepID=UPI0023538BE9|nr:glycosyltransferase family 41 protein [Sphaerotilus sulfidivorans]MCK6403142.1 hypothetical protein [Sphaerotilus sulfidivorans]